MSKSDYVERTEEKFAAQLAAFRNNVGGYATLLALPAATVTAQAADANYYAYSLAVQRLAQNYAQQWTEWRTLMRQGGDAEAPGAPTALVLPAAVAVVAPGIEVRFRALAKQIKGHPAYNQSIGRALGIEAPEDAGVDLATLQPKLEARAVGGQVEVLWGWQGNRTALDMIEIQVDRGDGQGFRLLTFDTTPNYTDTAPQPAAAVRWAYRAIYRVGDARVGLWSQDATVTVGAR